MLTTHSGAAETEESVFDITENVEEEATDSVFNSVATSQPVNTTAANEAGFYDSGRVIALNKITANSKKMTIPVGGSAYYNNAEIKLEKCWKSPDLYRPSSQVLVTVLENKFDDDPKVIFHGWIISSNPAVSTIEHPVYEVIAVECAGNRLHQ